MLEMNADMVIGQLKELFGRLLEEIALVVGNEDAAVEGKRYQLIGDLQFRAGLRQLDVQDRVGVWMARA